MNFDATFTGNEFRLRTGLAVSAKATKTSPFFKLEDGLYDLEIMPTVEESKSRFKSKIGFAGYKAFVQANSAASAANRVSLKRHLISLDPIRRANRSSKTHYLHDYRYKGRLSGIQIRPQDFDLLKGFADIQKKHTLRLNVEQGNKAPWMKTAIKEIGVKEFTAKGKSNTEVEKYSDLLTIPFKDDVAWCGFFVGWVMKKNGFQPPKYPEGALNWANFGRAIKKPTYGCIGYKRRGGANSKKGHVAFIVGQTSDGKKLWALGGNQADQVKISPYDTDKWLGFVLPKDYDSKNDWLPVRHGDTSVIDSQG